MLEESGTQALPPQPFAPLEETRYHGSHWLFLLGATRPTRLPHLFAMEIVQLECQLELPFFISLEFETSVFQTGIGPLSVPEAYSATSVLRALARIEPQPRHRREMVCLVARLEAIRWEGNRFCSPYPPLRSPPSPHPWAVENLGMARQEWVNFLPRST